MQPPSDQIISVKAFLEILNETLTFAFPAVTVEGEVSSFKVNQGKWIFFDLKDEDATLPCFMPKFQLKVPLEDGMKIRVTGVPKITNWGKFSFTVKSVELAGEGELKRAFEILKAKLEKEGLFDESRKRILPSYPTKIGLITSGQSAAYADFIKILGQRWGSLEITLVDIQVQGAAAPNQIIGAINYFNQLASPPDVLIIIRGGGSLEDLQAFSTEDVARSIAASRTPTIVGVGHEIDFSLADFVADRRAATPTDAARLVVPDRAEVMRDIDHRQRRLFASLRQQINNHHHKISKQLNILERFVSVPRAKLVRLESSLAASSRQVLINYRQRLASTQRLLSSFDPTATLKRGYAIVRHEGEVVTSRKQVSSGNSLVVQLAEGTLKTTVDKDE